MICFLKHCSFNMVRHLTAYMVDKGDTSKHLDVEDNLLREFMLLMQAIYASIT